LNEKSETIRNLFFQVNIHAIGYHDSLIAYAEMLNETLQRGGNMFDAAAIAQRMKNRTFYGIRGRLTLDENADLKGNFEIWGFQYNSSTYTVRIINESLHFIRFYFGTNRGFTDF
jgi:hypothetical protein